MYSLFYFVRLLCRVTGVLANQGLQISFVGWFTCFSITPICHYSPTRKFCKKCYGIGHIFNYFYVKWNTAPKHFFKYTLIWITCFVNSPPLYTGGQTPRVPMYGVTLQYINSRIHWHTLPPKKNVKIILKILQYRMATRVLKSRVLVISLLIWNQSFPFVVKSMCRKTHW